MQYEKEISQLEKQMFDTENNLSTETIDIAINAIEKQVKMKMTIETEPDRVFRDYRCPRCKVILQQEPKTNIGQRFVLHTFKYCPDCGQALDWSDD